jgi:hypothetical protein
MDKKDEKAKALYAAVSAIAKFIAQADAQKGKDDKREK